MARGNAKASRISSAKKSKGKRRRKRTEKEEDARKGRKWRTSLTTKGRFEWVFEDIKLTRLWENKNIKAVTLANGNFCVVRVGELIYVCDCNSTAYKYPLIDGELFDGPGGVYRLRLTGPVTIDDGKSHRVVSSKHVAEEDVGEAEGKRDAG